MEQKETLKVLFLSAEVVPFAKTGGLADVAGSLPKALKKLGVDVRVGMPRYGPIDPTKFDLTTVLEPFDVPMDGQTLQAGLSQATIGQEVPVYMVENDHYYNREGIYMYPDDAERFIFFCRALLEGMKRLGWSPDVVHCNDWHTAIVPNWLKTVYQEDPFYKGTATIYTIHNLAYQGIFGYRVLEVAGIDEFGFIVHPDIPDLDNVVDMMGRGIYFADLINTVSETYAQEILTPEYGENLDPLLRDRRDRIFGVLNGIDPEVHNPATDPYIAAHYDLHDLVGKTACKRALQAEAGLPQDPYIPLIGAISRLTDQKGFDLIAQVIDPLVQNAHFQFVLLGTGDQRYHELFQQIQQRYPERVSAFLTFNAPLAQKIYAGSDMFLMPSRFEPCGLGQLIAMRYGSIPIVRSTGGLADTVQDLEPETGFGNGFSFQHYSAMALYGSIIRALENYKYEDTWRRLMAKVMSADYSWSASARKYVDLYRRALAARTPRPPRESYQVGGPPAEES
ncbi:MAG: glycogen synthase [Chloroflexia bacterium]|nr:glycogen synthase [Chloroflexia bacterium]